MPMCRRLEVPGIFASMKLFLFFHKGTFRSFVVQNTGCAVVMLALNTVAIAAEQHDASRRAEEQLPRAMHSEM